MKYKSQLWLTTLLVTTACALFAPERAAAQQAAANAIDQLTAPIALYPDAIVIQILTTSKNYGKVELFATWLEKNSNLKGSELQDAAQKAGFDTALIALAPFPQVVKMMVEKPDWTKALGQAVTTDKKGVSDSIQRLRAQAQAVGNLKTTPQQIVTVTNVIVERTVEQQVVVVTNTIIQIQPANPQVIYVPTYNPTVVYVQAPPPSSSATASAALVGFTVGVIVANNSYYHNRYDDYWDDREDAFQARQVNQEGNQNQRQQNSQERQGERQGNQDERQTGRQENQGQRQSSTPAQSQGQANQSQRQSPATTTASSRGSGPSTSQNSGMSSGGVSGYQSGSATRSQSSRGKSSMSSSRGGGKSGGRSGGGRGR